MIRGTFNGRAAFCPLIAMLVAGVLISGVAPCAAALDDEHWAKANESIKKGIAFLRTTQNEDGSWSPQPGPAVTAMIVDVMLAQPNIGPDDPQVAKALEYILAQVNEDGSIHSGMLDNYNTSISLSALVRVRNDPRIAAVIGNAEAFLRGIQWKEGMVTPDGEVITKDHPYYGGVGYGRHGRPDGSNLQYMLQAMHDAGVDCEDPVFQRAMVFVSRLQGIESNDKFADKIEPDGGFIYATSINKDHVGVPQSMANQDVTDAVIAGEPFPEGVRLRTYGSMTYAMFKSMIYAELDRDDERVKAVRGWVSRNWELDRNPGMPINEERKTHLQGLFYYYTSMSRALGAWGTQIIELEDGRKVDWENELVAKVVSLQAEDGSWVNDADRWFEGDPNLVTAYALQALVHAMR